VQASPKQLKPSTHLLLQQTSEVAQSTLIAQFWSKLLLFWVHKPFQQSPAVVRFCTSVRLAVVDIKAQIADNRSNFVEYKREFTAVVSSSTVLEAGIVVNLTFNT